MTALRLDRLNKAFGKGPAALRDLSLEVAAGDCLTVIGPSGAGKTTLLRIIAGLDYATFGRIFFNDIDATALPAEKRDVAMVFQNPALYPHLSVFENIAFPLRLRKKSAAEIESSVSETAKLLGVESLLKRLPSELSGGEAQRVALGRALVRRPALLLMDEPLSGLPPDARLRLRHELLRLRQAQRITTVYVTHDHEEALALGDRVAILNAGELQQVGSPREVYERPANRFVATFLGRPPMNFLPEGGIRPDAIRICAEGESTHAGVVESVHYLGACSDLVVKVGDGEIIVRQYGPMTAKPGARIFLRVRPEDIHKL
jgi:multiple sugar transport system ATP-binding protein